MKYALIKTILFFLILSAQVEAANKFLLICGPSGIGKSTVIKALSRKDSRFIYVTPYTTRPLREKETDKKRLSKEEMLELDAQGELINLNYIHGNYYGAPMSIVREAFEHGGFPVIDWPVDKVSVIREKFKKQVCVIYLYPSHLSQLKQQLSFDGRDRDGTRFLAGKQELSDFSSGKFDSLIDFSVENGGENIDLLVEQIYSFYDKSCASTDFANQ